LGEKFGETTNQVFGTELRYLGIPSNTLNRINSCVRLDRRLPARMPASATPNQVWDGIVRWHGNATDPMEIDLVDLSYLSNNSVTKMPSWLVNIYKYLTERLIAIEQIVSELATRDHLATAAFPGLLVQYR
jgi:hypothetical protein